MAWETVKEIDKTPLNACTAFIIERSEWEVTVLFFSVLLFNKEIQIQIKYSCWPPSLCPVSMVPKGFYAHWRHILVSCLCKSRWVNCFPGKGGCMAGGGLLVIVIPLVISVPAAGSYPSHFETPLFGYGRRCPSWLHSGFISCVLYRGRWSSVIVEG